MERKSMRKYEEQPAREPEHKAERTRGRDSSRETEKADRVRE